jgi:putative transposase
MGHGRQLQNPTHRESDPDGRTKLSPCPGAIFHSDRGSNYTSGQFAQILESLNIRHSVGRTGLCFDNAMAESFFGVLKNERVHRTVYPTRRHAMTDVARYIEFRYNE